MKPDMQKVAYNLYWKRMDAGLTQRQLADRAGVTLGTVNRIERARLSPHVSTLQKVATALGIRVADLLEGSR